MALLVLALEPSLQEQAPALEELEELEAEEAEELSSSSPCDFWVSEAKPRHPPTRPCPRDRPNL